MRYPKGVGDGGRMPAPWRAAGAPSAERPHGRVGEGALEATATALGQVPRDVNKTRDDLKKVAVVIHNAARAIAVAEEVGKLLLA
jgi:hypothetical protein